MDQLKIGSEFMKGIINKMITNKARRYIKDISITNLDIERQKDTSYKVRLNCDIYLTESQVSRLLGGV